MALRLGTRGSRLALWQANAVADRLAAALAPPGRKWLAVPGGSTPAKVFAALEGLREEKVFAEIVVWELNPSWLFKSKLTAN